MQVVSSTTDFLERPAGRCIFGRRWLYFCAHDRLHGCTLWGEPTRDDIDALVVILVGMLDPAIPVHGTLVDTTRVEGMDTRAFESLARYVGTNRPRLERRIDRVAIARPSGLFGAAARGFFAIIEPPYEVEVFAKVPEALRWLGEPRDLAMDLERLHQRAAETSPLLRDLRTLLAEQLGRASLPSAARSLGVSPRALQRHLHECSTTFREEQHTQQIIAAEHLLLAEASITQVAYAIGCASPAHFSELFRKRKGESPTMWRLSQDESPPSDQRAAG